MAESPINPAKILFEGCNILDEILLPHHFLRGDIITGKGSGGYFAYCVYERADRRLEVHFRYALGIVKYHLGSLSVSHKSYMLTLLGKNGGNQYPGFTGDDPLNHFRQVAHDLKCFGEDFLTGDAQMLKKAILEIKPQKSFLP